jgi:Protein of unknown function (DUF3987)
MDNQNPERFSRLTKAELPALSAGGGAAQDDGKCIMPVLADAPPAPLVHPIWGKPSATWTYRDATGKVRFHVCRFDPPGKRKQFLPLSLWCKDGRLAWRWKGVPEPRPLYGLDRLAKRPDASGVVCEGEKSADAAARIFPKSVAVSSSGGSQSASKADWTPLAGRKILIWPDADEPGSKFAGAVAGIIHTKATEVSIIDAAALASIAPDGGKREPKKGWDAADAAAEWKDIAALRKAAHGLAKAFDPEAQGAYGTFGTDKGRGVSGNEWPQPKPLSDGLLPVVAFDPKFLPEAIAPWVTDISDRMQCPPDFVAIPAMAALGSVIGRKVAVRPQRKTDWYVVPNLWGCIVGRPGAMKSPAMDEALKPLHRLEAEARKANEVAAKDYAARLEFHKLQKEDAQKKARKGFANGTADASSLLLDEPEEPKARRYMVNDATYEALGVILADNPNGTLAFRDELVSLLKNLDREEQVSARGFFLTAWNGTTGYTFDRILRGKTHIEAACLSLLGSTQPGRLAEYMRGALSGGASDDGMIQRFSLLVWPDQSPEWREVDRYPASEPRAAAWKAFQRVDELTPDAIGAAADEFAPVPYVRFDDAGQGVFVEWRQELETRLRSDDLAPALESHFAKYRKLVPALALINHLADGGTGTINKTATLRALVFAEYLESHARRAYGAGSDVETSAAKAILAKVRKGDLSDGFSARDIYRNHWADLSDRNRTQAGLGILDDLDWLRGERVETGGRASVAYRVNPRGLA